MPTSPQGTRTPARTNGAAQLRRPRRFLARYGPWAVVTGGSSGLGLATADALAAAGFNLVLVARRRAALDRAAADLSARHHIEARVLDIDLAAPDGPQEMLDATLGIDVGLLVAAAGFGSSGPFVAGDPRTEDLMLAVNCRAVLVLARQFAQRLVERGGGGIVLFGSLVGFQGAPNSASYAATKAYVQTLAEALHVELRSSNVDVLSAAPGPVHSGFAARAGMRMSVAARPDDLAAPILRALGHRGTVVPGALAKLLTSALSILPRSARVRVMGNVMKGMVDADA